MKIINNNDSFKLIIRNYIFIDMFIFQGQH